MAETPLETPAEIYRPFSRGETAQLRAFVEDVRRLGRMSFFKQVPKKATLTFDEEGMWAEMEEPDDEAVRAAVTQFRQIYSHTEPHSFQKTMKLLKRSVHERDSPLHDKALEDLDGWIDLERQTLRDGIGIGIQFESPEGNREIDPRTLLDAYFHGRYLHSGNPKTELVDNLEGIPPIPRMTVYSVMLRLRNVYWGGANVAERVLKVPELLDAE